MADEHKPQQDAEQEALTPAETETPDSEEALTVEITELADDAADTAEAAEEISVQAAEAAENAEEIAERAADSAEAAEEIPEDVTALFAEVEAEIKEDAAQNAEEPAKQSASAFAGKADAFKEKAAGLAGKLKDKAGQLSDDFKKSNAKKKQAKRKSKERTIEEELADLAEEEKQFDEWGRKIKRKRKFRRRKSRKLSCTLVLLTLILASSSVLAAGILAVAKEMYGIDKDVATRIITIPDGASTLDIANQLVDERIISLPQVFRLVSRMNGMDGSYIAGEHTLSASMSYEAMIDELCQNHEDERESMRVVFPEGITLMAAAQKLQENQICKADDFLFYFNGGGYGFRFEEYLPEKNAQKWQQREGYCFPDTYDFYVDEDPNIVAQKIYANFDSKLTDGDYKKMEELNMTLDQVITLASMVQAEGRTQEYIKHIAAVFHNRLQSPAIYPRLESDPTRKYADLIANNLPIRDDIMTTAYNTYKATGLPPGAINNPGRTAIEAVLYPLSPCTDYFFNANIDTGETFFAETYDQHLANLATVEAQYAAAEAAANGEG